MATKNYDHALGESNELTASARSRAPIEFRGDILAAVLKALGAKRSVLLVGPTGVGKTTIVHALAQHLKQSGPRKLYEFATVQLLSGTVYLGEWQSKVSAIFDLAASNQALLYFSDVWNLPSVGRSSGTTDSVWDALRPRLLNGSVQVIGELTREQLQQLSTRAEFTSAFEIIDVPPLTSDQIGSIVRAEAARLGLALDERAAARLLELCNDFMPSTAGPGAALQLVRQTRHYLDEKRAIGEDEPVSPEFVEKVFSVYTGLPRFVVSRREVRPVGEIRDWFRQRIIGQRDAIEAVVQMITLFKAGLHDAHKPIGSFLFVGPTGVGKTELARALAAFLFGSEKRLLRFDMSEFKDYHSFQMLIGDPGSAERPARLIDPVRAQPFQVVLLDEIEKAHANVWDLLLQLLDDGRLTPAHGPAVSFRNTIVIATSNVGAQALERPSVGFTGGEARDDGERLHAELETVFRPELLNRFQHVVRFRRLTPDEAREIARAELARLLEREGIVARRLVVDIDKEVLDLAVASGYDEKYGARALKRELQRRVIMPIATLLLERRVEDASILRLAVRHGEIKVSVLESESVREQRRESEPLRLADGQRVTRESLAAMLRESSTLREAILSGLGVGALKLERERLEATRTDAQLWSNPRAAAQVLEACDRLDKIFARLDRLAADEQELHATLNRADKRASLIPLAGRIRTHCEAVATAHRELCLLGEPGEPDALLVITPIGRATPARDLLYRTYASWAGELPFRVTLVCEPRNDDEPVVLLVRGSYAHGYLRGEAGLHRVRTDRDTHVARVSVAPVVATELEVAFGAQKALKQIGQLGGRVRSRVEVRGSDLIVQNGATLAENRELAMELAATWQAMEPAPESVVRRYDLEPFLVKDFLTDFSTGRTDALYAAPFHRLLCRRIEAATAPRAAS